MLSVSGLMEPRLYLPQTIESIRHFPPMASKYGRARLFVFIVSSFFLLFFRKNSEIITVS